MWELLENHTFEIDSQLLAHVKCVLCEKLLIDAHEGLCGCNYCQKCVTKYMENEVKLCPGDSADCKLRNLQLQENIIRSNSTNRKISKLMVTCPSENCTFKCELSVMSNHLRICDKRAVYCPFKYMGCSQSAIQIEDISNHLISELYQHSQLLIEWIVNMKNEMVLVNISNSSGQIEMCTSEQSKDISLRKLKYNDDQIHIETSQRDLQDSSEINFELMKEINKIKDEQQIEIKQLKEFIESKLEQMRFELREMKNKDLESMKFSSESYKNEEENILKKDNEIKSMECAKNQIETKGKISENLCQDYTKTSGEQLQEKNVTQEDLEIQISPQEEINKLSITSSQTHLKKITTFIWTIPDVSRVKKKNVVVDSQYFFSENGEFKMWLDFYIGNRVKMRIRFYVCSMTNNSKPNWPFTCLVVMTIKDSTNPDASQKISKNCNFSKPKFNSAYETFDFLYSDLEQVKVLQNNSILIECVVESER